MGMEEKMERLEYALNPLDQSNHGSEDVLLTICDNSQGSQDVVAPSSEDIQYEVRNSDGVLQYRFLNNTTENNPVNGNMNTTQVGNTLQSTNCQFYVISDLSTSRPCLITPKTEAETAPGCTRHLVVNTSKKRDEKRRATHNEVERRRRDKINQWIFKLKDLLPDTTDQKNKNAMGDSKGEILIKACDYIKAMQQQVDSLKECLNQNETLRSQNNLLKEENQKLHEEKQHLLKLLGGRTDIKMESEIEFETS